MLASMDFAQRDTWTSRASFRHRRRHFRECGRGVGRKGGMVWEESGAGAREAASGVRDGGGMLDSDEGCGLVYLLRLFFQRERLPVGREHG